MFIINIGGKHYIAATLTINTDDKLRTAVTLNSQLMVNVVQ